MRNITTDLLLNYKNHLTDEEKSPATIEKYLFNIREFDKWMKKRELNKALVLEYKNTLIKKYSPASVNTVLASLSSFFSFCKWYDLKVKNLKIQKQIFISAEKELTKEEYERLLRAAKEQKNERLYLLMQTICATGIRVSELRYITLETVNCGSAVIKSKGKHRQVFLPNKLCKILKSYIKKQKIKNGPVFVTRNGKPLDRSNIWSDMKKLCCKAGVSNKKVFPHNFRHLFARTYYNLHKDLVRLADILGHLSINTTRIYTMESGKIHRKQIENLALLRC